MDYTGSTSSVRVCCRLSLSALHVLRHNPLLTPLTSFSNMLSESIFSLKVLIGDDGALVKSSNQPRGIDAHLQEPGLALVGGRPEHIVLKTGFLDRTCQIGQYQTVKASRMWPKICQQPQMGTFLVSYTIGSTSHCTLRKPPELRVNVFGVSVSLRSSARIDRTNPIGRNAIGICIRSRLPRAPGPRPS